jgi:nucleoside-diphosphate-sugar epimerase
VDAYLHLAELTEQLNINGEAFNFSRDEPLSVRDIHKSVYEAVGIKYLEPIVRNLARSEIKDQHLDSKKAREVLKWESKVSLIEGLKNTAVWYSDYFSKSKS